jgi:hypothetical protein
VHSFFESRSNNQPIEITGWLVIINDELYLLDDNLCEDYKKTMKIKVTNRSIIYPIRQAILPLGGGESFVFHKAKLKGYVSIDPWPEIKVEKLWIQESGQADMILVDISKDSIEAAKQRYEAVLNFDFFKEMGDR